MLAAADALPAEARAAMDEQALHRMLGDDLGAWWPTPTATSPARSPGRSARPTRSAWRRSSTSRPRCCAPVAILAQPVMPQAAGKLLDLLGVQRATRAISPQVGERRPDWSPGHGRCRRRRRSFRATSNLKLNVGQARFETASDRLRRTRMLVDSHCHLDFPGLRRRARRGRRRARGRRASARWSPSRPASAIRRCRSRDRRALSRTCSARSARIRIKPPRSSTSPVDELVRAGARIRRCVGIGEAGLDYHYDIQPARTSGRARLPRHIAAARATELAARHPRARRR